MRILPALLCIFFTTVTHAQPDVPSLLLTASRHVFATSDQTYLASLSPEMILVLTNQIKKTVGIPPETDWNMTSVRHDMSDETLMRLFLLATVGNFTTGATHSSWEQPCKVVINSRTGLLQLDDSRSMTDQILSVLVIILCVVQLQQLLKSL
jgi:hypothetical protein